MVPAEEPTPHAFDVRESAGPMVVSSKELKQAVDAAKGSSGEVSERH